jgi:rare lipoprotein A
MARRAGNEARMDAGIGRAGRWLVPAAMGLAVAGCGTTRYRPVSDAPVRIGKPYAIRGVTHVPRADPAYDALGYASWYGNESGNQTANGERFRPDWVTAAHRTLPLPTYVEVTALDTGRTILVRINDRGPFARGRIIDLSKGAAEALGIRARGHAAVRVRRVEPEERDRERLRKGKGVVERRRVPESMLASLRAQLATGPAAGAIEGR